MTSLILAALVAAGVAAAPEPFPSVAARTAGLERHDGFLPFYWDARQGRLLLEVARPREEFLYGAGLAGGAGTVAVPLDRGQLGALALVRFERVGPRVLLRQLPTSHRAGGGGAEAERAVAESFPSAVLAALPVVAEDPGRALVDASDFLLADPGFAPMIEQAGQGKWRHDVARSAPQLERSGAFPINTEIEAALTFTSDDAAAGMRVVLPDGRTLTLLVHHTFRALPPAGFTPRAYDPRVGFIAQGHKDYGAPRGEPLERYLAPRWRLVKKDPQAARSEPVEPIVYYLDRAIPEPERTAIRAAALWWNHAFEEAGFDNALVVRDLPEGATLLDARYSGIEWIHRDERAWSIGQFQTDPRTGEILHAVARIDSHRRRTTARQWWNMARPRPGACAAWSGPDAAWLAAFDADGAVDEEALVLQRLAYLSAHEVGHTLGLAHNWAATTFGWGSVMDYLAANVQPKGDGLDLSDAFPRDVGAYDRLMVRWGYTPDADAAARDAVVREAYARGIVYPLESDPRWAEYDWGPDPVAWLASTQAVRRVILERFGAAQLPSGAPLYELQSRFNLAYLYHRFGIQAAQQHVGGQYQANALAGDGQTPLARVPASKQEQALGLLLAALEPRNLDVPERILDVLVPAPAEYEPTRERFASDAGATFSLPSAARALCDLIVRPLVARERAARLTLVEAPDTLTLEALLRRLVAATWDEPAAATPRLRVLQRVTQRAVLEALLDRGADAQAAPEVRALVRAALARLRLDLAARRSPDAVTEAHLRLAEHDLAEFFEHPDVRQPRPPATPPPGRPIGR
jgi:hypothetical protein